MKLYIVGLALVTFSSVQSSFFKTFSKETKRTARSLVNSAIALNAAAESLENDYRAQLVAGDRAQNIATTGDIAKLEGLLASLTRQRDGLNFLGAEHSFTSESFRVTNDKVTSEIRNVPSLVELGKQVRKPREVSQRSRKLKELAKQLQNKLRSSKYVDRSVGQALDIIGAAVDTLGRVDQLHTIFMQGTATLASGLFANSAERSAIIKMLESAQNTILMKTMGGQD